MRVNLSGHDVDVIPALRSYTGRKFGRVLRRFDRVIEMHCTLTVDKLRHRAATRSCLHSDAGRPDGCG